MKRHIQMEYSLASYLAPLFLSSPLRGVRFFYEGKHVWDALYTEDTYRRTFVIKSPNGSIFQQDVKYVSGKGYVENNCHPLHSPLRQFIQDYIKGILDPSTMDVSKFTVKRLQAEQSNKNTYYASPTTYTEAEELIFPWNQPWDCENGVEKLKQMCRNEKKNIPLVLRYLYSSSCFQQIRDFIKKSRYRDSFSVTVGNSPSFVFLNDGSLYDYKEKEVFSQNLDKYIWSYLNKAAGEEITWEEYCEHIYIKRLPLKMWLEFVKTKVDELEKIYITQFWSSVVSRVVKGMTFVQGDTYWSRTSPTYDVELFAFDTINQKMESYNLNSYGIFRTFGSKPYTNNMTKAEQEEWQRWKADLTQETFKELVDRPNICWFGRLRRKWGTSSMEPIQISL